MCGNLALWNAWMVARRLPTDTSGLNRGEKKGKGIPEENL